jgi:hypothetical protein
LNICLTLPIDTELSMVSSLTLTQRAMTRGTLTDGFKFAAITSSVEKVGTLVVGSEGQNIVMQVTMASPFYLTQSVPQAVPRTVGAAGEVVLKLVRGDGIRPGSHSKSTHCSTGSRSWILLRSGSSIISNRE